MHFILLRSIWTAEKLGFFCLFSAIFIVFKISSLFGDKNEKIKFTNSTHLAKKINSCMLRMPMFIKADNKLLKMLFVIYFEFL